MVDIPETRTAIEAFLDDYLAEADADGYVVGVSGGLDSAVTLTVAADAVGPANVQGLVMPGEPSTEENMEDARELCRDRGVAFHDIAIEPVVDAVRDHVPFDPDRKTLGNTRVRTRMLLLYAAANQEDLLVLGASNRTELLLGYFTKWGDQAADVRPIADLYKTEVRELGRELELPHRFTAKEPTAGMWEGQTDEEELGASYEEIDAVLQRFIDDEMSVPVVVDETGIDRETVEHVIGLHEGSRHKREPVPSPDLR